jgi:hypothetical protein
MGRKLITQNDGETGVGHDLELVRFSKRSGWRAIIKSTITTGP